MCVRRLFPRWFLVLLILAPAFAGARSFRLDGREIELADVTDTVEVYVSSLRRDVAAARWVFELRVRNTAVQPLARPCVVALEGLQNTPGPVSPDGVDATGKAWFNLSSTLPPSGLAAGEYSQARTLSLGMATGVPRLTFRVFAGSAVSGPPLALVRTLDGVGLPLAEVQVTAVGPAGEGTATTDERSAVTTLGRGAGLNTFRFEAPGYLPVWREGLLVEGSVRELPSPRLVARETNSTRVTPFGGSITNAEGGITLEVPAGAVSEEVAVRITALAAQSLPALLPVGWSPLQAFWLEVEPVGSAGSARGGRALAGLSGVRGSATPRLGAGLPVRLGLWDVLGVGESGVLARWNTNSLRWEVRGVVTGQGSSVVGSALDAAGAWALVVGDAGVGAPPDAEVGQPLPAGVDVPPDWLQVAATGRVAPEFTPASPEPALVTAEGEVVISNRVGRLHSGTLLRAVVRERYELRDGAVRATPGYDAFLSLYRRPGAQGDSVLRARMPLRPQLLLGADELSLASVQVDVYPPTQFGGALFTPEGGSIRNGTMEVSAAAGVMRDTQAVRLESLARTNFTSFLTNGLEWVAAFQLTVGELAAGGRLEFGMTGVPANGRFVLSRVLADRGIHGLQPVERYTSDSAGVLRSAEPGSGPRLRGVDGSGQYLLVQVADRVSLVTGTARDAGAAPAARLLVSLGPWTALSGAGGLYGLVAPAGTADVRVYDPVSEQAGRTSVTVGPGEDPVLLDVAVTGEGPRVVAITPPDLATNVAPVAPVEVTFSRPLNRVTVTSEHVRLLDGAGEPVVAAVVSNLRGDVVSVLPTQPLASGVEHTLVLDRALKDLRGLPLEGRASFRFRTAPAVPPRTVPLALTAYEPTNGVARVEGTPGMAEPGRGVVLSNETTGRTATVLAGVDGSFSGTIEAGVDDVLSVTLLNANGTANRLPMTRQVFADGSVALFSQGGTIEVPGEHGPIAFEIEAGSVSGKTRFKFESVPLATVLTLVSNTQPEGGRVLGGVKVAALQGGSMSGSMDVSFPVSVADMQLPAGVNPTNCGFGLTIAREVDGAMVFELVDRMHYEDGRLVTHSPPFFGLLGPFEDILVLPLLLTVAEVPMLVNGKVVVTDVDPATGRPLAGAPQEPLPGALVSGRGPTTTGGLRGRLRPGTVFAVSGPDGGYTLMVTVDASSASRAVAVSASHSRFPGVLPESVIPPLSLAERFAIGNLLTRRDIVFPRTGGVLDVAPTVAVSHAPALPEAGAEVVVVFTAMDDSTAPLLTVEVQGVAPVGATPPLRGDVVFRETGMESQGATGMRGTYTVKSLRPQVVQLRARALDGNGRERVLQYPVVFGAPAPEPADNPPPADAHDDVGPYVVGMTPPAGSGALAPGEPVVIRFNEAIRREVLSAPNVVSLNEDGGVPRLELSPDQTVLAVTFPRLSPDRTYTLTVGYGVQDLSGNTIDQRPGDSGNQVFVATFRTALARVTSLDDVVGRDAGAGVMMLGRYALIAERRGSDRGRLAVMDVSVPTSPRFVNEISLPSFPRDVLLLPRYAYATTNGLPNELKLEVFTDPQHPNRLVRTNDLVVAVGGLAGQGQLQWIRVVDVTDPLRPELVSGMVIGVNGLALPGRLRWAPPSLAYLETSLPDRVSVVNLQSLIIADLLSMNQAEYRRLPADGAPGLDLNGDGDYVDAGEILPLPAHFPVEFGGKEFAMSLPDTDQVIVDYVVEKGGGYLGALVGPGRLLGSDGNPRDDRPVAAGYRTLLDDGVNPPRELASHEFASNRRVRRAEALFQYPVRGTNGLALRDLVLVTLAGDARQGDTNNYIAVLDVTERLAVRRLSEIPVPKDSSEGGIHSISLREDGLLVVAQDRSSILLDPQRMTDAVGGGGTHPAVLGTIEGLGGSPRRFESLGSGVHVTADAESRARVIQTPPWLGFAGFAGVEPVDPSTLAQRTEAALEGLMQRLEARDFLALARLREGSVCDPLPVTNLDARTHHYVLVRAPGGAGRSIELALESLSWSGQPLRKRGVLFPPVHALGAASLDELGQTPAAGEAGVRSLRAYRVSDRPTSPFFNLYVSRSFLLVADAATPAELADLRAVLDREVLWSGDQVRASLDPSQATNEVLAPFVGRVDLVERVHKPGVMTVADAFPADLLPSPNPGPLVGEMLLPVAMNALTAHSAELVIEATDLVIPGRRMPFEFRRTFRGQSLFEGPFGRGWDFGYNQRVVPMAAGSDCYTVVSRPDPAEAEVAGRGDLMFHTGGGQVVLFKDAGTNAPPEVAADPLIQQLGWLPRAARFYLPPPGLFAPMLRFKDGQYVRLEPDGRQYWFNPSGRLDRIYDRYEQNVIRLVYNARGELARILDDRGKPVDIGYYRVISDTEFRGGIDERVTRAGDVGRIARLKDDSGRDVLYRYTADGLLERSLGPEIATGPADTFRGRAETVYRYSDGSQLDRTARSLIGLEGNDVSGAPILAATGLGQRGRDTVGALSLMGQSIEVSQPYPNTARALAENQAPVVVTSQDGSISRLSLDALGRVTQAVLESPSGPAVTNRQEYHTAGPLKGLVRATVGPLGDRTEFLYDAANPSLRSRGNLSGLRKIPGARGGPVLEASTQYDPLYNLASGEKTDFNGTVTTIVLAPDRRSVERLSRGGERELFGVNEFGQPVSHTSMEGTVTRWDYTPEGHLSSRSVGALQTLFRYAPVSGGASDPGRRGRPSQVIDPSGVPTTFLHDELDRVVMQEREGLRTTSSFDAAGNLARRVSQVETNRAVVEEFQYLSHGFLREHRVKNVEVDGLPVDLVTTYTRDAMNRVQTVIFPGGEVRRFAYDSMGRIEREEVPGSHTNRITFDAAGNMVAIARGLAVERHEYDGHERLVRTVGANGTVVEYLRDGNGNVTTNRVFAADGTLLTEARFAFDPLNRVREKSVVRDDGVSTIRVDYNSGERSVTVTDALGAVARTVLDPEGRTARVEAPNHQLELTWDPNSNVTQRRLTDAGGTFVSGYAFNTRNQVVAATNSAGDLARWVPDLDGRQVLSIDREAQVSTNVFTLLGEVAGHWKPNGVSESRAFNASRNIVRYGDGATNLTLALHDAQNRMVTNRLPNGAETVFRDFTTFGQPGRVLFPRGVEVASTYDDEGKLRQRLVTGGGFASRTETFEYDGLRRLRRVADPSGTMSMRYDLSGFVRTVEREYRFGAEPVARVPMAFVLEQNADAGFFRTELRYPGGFRLMYGRDVSGRLTSLIPSEGEPVIWTNVWVGDTRLSSRVLGNERIRLDLTFDALPRITGRRYTRVSDGAVLVEVRQVHDRNGAVLARQHLHRGGRTDVFAYDPGYRLTRADLGARPGLTGETAQPVVPGFVVPARLGGGWQSGAVARSMDYDGTDVLRSVATLNPLNLAVSPVASSFAGHDALLCALEVDGFSRTTDEVGNVTRTRLSVRLPGRADPELVSAELAYDSIGRLVRVTREDGVVVVNEYEQNGLRMRRAVTGPVERCVPSDIAFLHDGARLIEERDLARGGAILRRYFYSDDGDELVAADVRTDPDEPLERVYFLTDNQRSVLALVDGAGEVLQRSEYDVWGQPVLETTDTAAPVVSWVRREADGVLIAFSEPVLPPVPATDGFVQRLAALEGLEVRVGSSPVAGRFVPEDQVPASGFGSVVRFLADDPLTGVGELRVAGGAVKDSWGNPCAPETVSLDLGGLAGAMLYAGVPPGSTAPQRQGRSWRGLTMLYHGQVYDEDTGLLYCRSRYYDPHTASFLQRDPAGYVDSVNPYTAFAHNPVSHRDPLGSSVWDDMRQMGETLQEDADKHRETGGPVNLLLSMVEEGFGGLLQMPAAVRDSWNVLQSPSQGGTLDLLNRMKAAEVVGKAPVAAVGVVASGVGAMQSLKTVSSFLASRARGMASTLTRRMRLAMGKGTAIDHLMTQGLTRWEAEGFVNAMAILRDKYKTDQVEAAVRGFGDKADLRRQNREMGMAVKPEWVKTKTSKEHGQVHVALKQGDGSVIHRDFTGDLDFYYMKVNGRRLEEHEFQQVKHLFNREMSKAYRRMGFTGDPGASVLHGTHMNLPELYGRRVEHLGAELGKKALVDRKGGGESMFEVLPGRRDFRYDMELFGGIKGPGTEAFAVRIDGMGRVNAYQPDVGVLRRELDDVARQFRQSTGIELGEYGWYRGFEDHLPPPAGQ